MSNIVKDWISEKEFSFHRIESLIFILFSGSLFLIKVLIPFIEKYNSHWSIPVALFVITYVLVAGYWYYNRTVFPVNKEGKEHIIIGIITENAKQKTRITNDFSKQIKKQISAFDLDRSYDITVLHNYQSTIIQRRISAFTHAVQSNYNMSSDIYKFNKLLERLNAKFIIYGDLIERNPENKTYCLSIDAMILHQPTSRANGSKLQQEFLSLWNKEITFLENEELTGFKANAEQVFFTATYMLGLATFVDNNYLRGIEIWERLELYIKDKPELSQYVGKIIKLKSAAYLLYSRFLYFKGEIAASMQFRGLYLDLFPNEYDGYLTEAINQLEYKNDPEIALEFVRKAAHVSPENDYTWRYSELYVLIKLGKCEEAIKCLNLILTRSYPTEKDTVEQVISYNTTRLEKDNGHIQTLFIVGILMYKKLNKPIEAYEKLETFISQSENNELYSPLVEKAKEHLNEINKVIGIKIEGC